MKKLFSILIIMFLISLISANIALPQEIKKYGNEIVYASSYYITEVNSVSLAMSICCRKAINDLAHYLVVNYPRYNLSTMEVMIDALPQEGICKIILRVRLNAR